MSRDRWTGLLDAYADESCTPEELAGLEAHFLACPACAAEALGRIQMKRQLRAAAARFGPSPEFRLKIESIAANGNRPAAPQGWFRRRFSGGYLWSAGILALLLVVASVALWDFHRSSEETIGELIDQHVATMASANPVDVISTDRHTVKPWFQGKIPFTFNLPELQNTPFKLVGGRVMYVRHTPGAQLLFVEGKHQISVFIVQDSTERSGLDWVSSGRVNAIQEKGFNGAAWSAGGLHYVVVGDASFGDVQALAQLLRAAAGS